jgi:hypothetical protein
VLEGKCVITRDMQRGSRWPRQELPPKSWWGIWSSAIRQVYA